MGKHSDEGLAAPTPRFDNLADVATVMSNYQVTLRRPISQSELAFFGSLVQIARMREQRLVPLEKALLPDDRPFEPHMLVDTEILDDLQARTFVSSEGLNNETTVE